MFCKAKDGSREKKKKPNFRKQWEVGTSLALAFSSASQRGDGDIYMLLREVDHNPRIPYPIYVTYLPTWKMFEDMHEFRESAIHNLL